jgi:hypothetical protein
MALKIRMVASMPPIIPGRRNTPEQRTQAPLLSGFSWTAIQSCHSSASMLGRMQRTKTLRQPIRLPR